jgi:hypothetical protein
MSNWLQKILPPAAAPAAKPNLAAKLQKAYLPVLAKLRKMELTKGLPPAAIVYGMAAGALFALALYFLFDGLWVNGLLTLLPAACFLAYAMHFIKHMGS